MPLKKAPLFGLLATIILLTSGCLSLTRPTGEAEQASQTPSPEATEPKLVASSSEPTPVSKPQAVAIDNVWQRLSAGIAWNIPENDRVRREFNWYLKHPKYLQRVQERARPYLFHIVEQIEQRGMPMELALLPVVESAFQPFAYSPGRAAGLWQFIPSTGRHFGLKQTWWYDGRRDVVAATDAALDYLQSLAKQFDGDWELALAAYNSGAGTVRKAIRRNQRKGKPTDYWSLKLPRETSGYVPRLLAISKLVREAEQHGITLEPIANRPYFTAVDVGGQIDLAKAAEMAGMSVKQLYLLNPAFNRWATDPDGPHRLLIPVGRAAAFEERLAALEPAERVQWARYRIRSGDSLSVIARRFNTTSRVLRQVNGLKSNRIRAGRHLMIPTSSQAEKSYAMSAEQRLAKVQNRDRKGTRVEYEVSPGDTLWDIARAHNVSHRALARWNAMAPGDTLRPGQTLVIWSRQPAKPEKVSVLDNVLPGDSPIDTRSTLRYRVRKGDSLARIASKFKVTVADLRRWNTLSGRYLQPGQTLKLHVDVTDQL